MSNDEKIATPVVADEVKTNNKDVAEEKQQLIEESTTNKTNENEAAAAAETNGKTQQVDATAAEPAAADAAASAKETPVAKAPKPTVHKIDFEKDVVYLYQFSRTANIPSPSCFCLKVETWLRMAGIKYQNVDHKLKFRSSKGQLPFVELNGEEIADSAVIIKEVGRHFNSDMDSHLSAEQRSVAHATTAMLENHFHWIDVWWRSKNPDSMLDGYKMDLKHMTDSKMPAALLKLVYRMTFRRKALKKVRATGIGVHTADEIIKMGQDDLQVLIDTLGDKPYFFGDEPTILDVVVFSNVAQLVVVDKQVAHPLRDWMLENGNNLVQHFEKIKEKYYPDWEEMCQTLDLNTHLPKPPAPVQEAEKKEQNGETKVDAKEVSATPATTDKEEEKEKQVEDEKEKETTEEKSATEAEEKPKETN